ncbi:MAG: hypothetical protein AAF378_07040 [Cyanobacteria bacterium P01_A01_bin.84]
MNGLDNFSKKEYFVLLITLSELKSENLNDDEREHLEQITSNLSVVDNR